MKNILSYKDYTSASLNEALDPFITASRKYRIGDSVKVKDRNGCESKLINNLLITEPVAPISIGFDKINVSCFGKLDKLHLF